MILSREHKFVFIHVPKAAGTSMRSALMPYAAGPVRYQAWRLMRRLDWHWKHVSPTPLKTHASAMKIMQYMGEDAFRSYRTFAFVRNPYDTCVSAYHYIRKAPFHPRHAAVSALPNFSAYVDYMELIGKIRVQTDYLLGADGQLLPQRIGRFENLHEDYASICSWLGIPCDLPHKNPSVRSCWEQYYTDHLRERVYKLFRRDFKLLGYSYD